MRLLKANNTNSYDCNIWSVEELDNFSRVFNSSDNLKDNEINLKESVNTLEENQVNITVYLLNYLKSTEYYKLSLLGQNSFEFSYDTSDTIDNYLYGINSVYMKFKTSDKLIQLNSYLNLGELLKDITILDLKLYVDVKFLQTKNIKWRTSLYSSINTSIIVNSDVDNNYSKNLYLELGIKEYKFEVDISKYTWEKRKYVLSNNIDFFINIPGDTSKMLLQYVINNTNDLNNIENLYQSNLNVYFNLKSNNLFNEFLECLESLNKGDGNKYLYLDKSLFLFSKENFYGDYVSKLNKNIIRLYNYFDEIFNY